MRFILLVLVYNMIVVDCVERCSHPQAEDGHQISEGCLLRTCKAGVWRTSLAGNLCCYERTAYTINTTISSSMSKDGCVKVDIDCVEEIPGQAKMILSMKNYCEEFATQEQVEEIKELLIRQREADVGCQGGDEEGEEKGGPSYLYLDSSTILDMNTLQLLPCQQDFPSQLSYFWSQAAVVPHNGQDRLMVCGGPYMAGCFVWTSASSGWKSLNTTFFNYRSKAASSMMTGGGWLVSGGTVGRLDGGGFNRSSSASLYSNNHWEEYSSVPVEVTGHCQVTLGDTVYIIGGRNSSNDMPVSTVYKLNDGTWTEYHSINWERYNHICAVLDNTVYVMGGSAWESVEVLRPDSNGWVFGPSLPGTTYNGQAVVYNGTLYVVNENGLLYRFDRSADLWLTEYLTFDFGNRFVFPAPLLTDEQLPCI